MEDHMQYIDDFFQGKLPDDEARAFEEKILKDPALAADVAFYLSAKQSARDLVDEEKKKRYKEIYSTTNGFHKKTEPARVIRMKFARVAMVAAIALAIIVTTILYNRSDTTDLANNYIKKNYTELSVTMGTEDDLQKAIELYNKEKYNESLAAFEAIIKKDSTSAKAVQYAGISALHIPDYDKALYYFKQLEGFRSQFSNPAVLLQAVTLMKRNKDGDKQQAKLLLQRVKNENLDGKELTEEWLKQF